MAVYLDYNATAPLRGSARVAWLQSQDNAWGNPSSAHSRGQQARHVLDQAKARIASCFNIRSSDLIITSGGTEANALAIHAAIQSSAAAAKDICVSRIDHSSVLRNVERQVVRNPPAQLHLLPVDAQGRLLPVSLAERLSSSTTLVCLQFANNELGTIQDLASLVPLVRTLAPQAKVLLDCCQGAGKQAIDLKSLDVDFASVAGHKFGAPRGCGVLYVRNGIRIDPLIAGGRQQQDRRSGSEDVAGVCALAAALEEGVGRSAQEQARQCQLLESCWSNLRAQLPHVIWLAHDAARLANTMSLAHPGVLGQELETRLDLRGFEVSRGSACMAMRGEPSHVIAALGLDGDLARSVIRVSIGEGVTAGDLEEFARAYVAEVTAMTGDARS